MARECDDEGCPLFIYRMGKNPARAGIGVGNREKNGRFYSKNTPPAVTSETKVADKRKDRGWANLINLEAPSKKISVLEKGTLTITENKGKILITITKKPKGGAS